MSRVSRAVSARAGEFLFRYMVARYRCVGGSLSAGRIRLAAEIRQGIQVFEDAILLNPGAQLPIRNDCEHHAFFRAILQGDNDALPAIEPAELAEWRDYVLGGGIVPKWREPVALACSPASAKRLVKHSVLDRIPEVIAWLRRVCLPSSRRGFTAG
jgi:hypothetical protein